MKDHTLRWKAPTSIIEFLQAFKFACDARKIHGGTAMSIFKQYLTDQAVEAVKARVTLSNTTNFYHEGALKSYSATIKFLLKRYIMDDNIANLNAKVPNHLQTLMTSADFAQDLQTKTLAFESTYDENFSGPIRIMR